MTKALLLLALITIASAQFTQNFTQVLIGSGSRGVLAVPVNITDPDGTTYFDLNRVSNDQPEGQWTLNFIAADGSITRLQDINNDLVAVSPDGSQTSISSQIPPVVGITGPELVQAVSTGVQDGVNSIYADPSLTRITTAQANTQAGVVINSLLRYSSLPPFFLTPFRTQALNGVSQSLANAQAVSAAINASLVAANPPPTDTPTTPTPTSVYVPLNLTSFPFDSLENVTEIIASHGNESVVVHLNSETEAEVGNNAAWAVDFETAVGTGEDNNEWQLSWVDDQGETWDVVDSNGNIVVVGANGQVQGDWTNEAGWWSNAEGDIINDSVGVAIEDFVDEVIANADKTSNVVINVANDGLRWTYAETNAEANA